MMMRFDLGLHDVIRFSGPDASRFLNGQITQDVMAVTQDTQIARFSCVTDAKGKIQFRMVLASQSDGALIVVVPAGLGEALETRLTRYLIADDVEVELLPGAIRIHHILGTARPESKTIIAKSLSRLGERGTDWWIPVESVGSSIDPPEISPIEIWESMRIERGIPAWGREITPGMLPPEAKLENTDISYHKGCYIGQEVISRIKAAGKTNRKLTRFQIFGDTSMPGPIHDHSGIEVGICTSISPSITNRSSRLGLGFLGKKAAGCEFLLGSDVIVIRPDHENPQMV